MYVPAKRFTSFLNANAAADKDDDKAAGRLPLQPLQSLVSGNAQQSSEHVIDLTGKRKDKNKKSTKSKKSKKRRRRRRRTEEDVGDSDWRWYDAAPGSTVRTNEWSSQYIRPYWKTCVHYW